MGIVTFTTDFGGADGYVGAMKGVVLSLAPGAVLIDVAHGVPAGDVVAGAHTLAQAVETFPPGAVHVAVVDPGVGTARADLVVEARNGIFVGPDNGVLSLAAQPPRRIFRITSATFRREPVSPTFHGRDVFAQAAGRLAAGAAPAEAGAELPALVALATSPLRQVGGRCEGVVTHLDAFGNLVTNIPGAAVGDRDGVEIETTSGLFRPHRGRTFGDVGSGEMVAYVGSGGFLEIAVRDGSAASRTGALRGTLVRTRGRA